MNIRPLTRRRAVALVIVLAMLAILSTLLVAFMGQVSTENNAATTAARGVEAKQAYDAAINLVMSQIREGTRTNETGGNEGSRGWASQPGAIRTFDISGNEGTVYKLYSSSQMKIAGASYNPSNPAESGIKDTNPAKLNDSLPGFVNLNDPLLIPIPNHPDPEGRYEPRYPIVNPSVRFTAPPILAEPNPDNANRSARSMVDGFYTPKILHPSGKKDVNGQLILNLPMRVKWLYQLKDGTLVAQDDAGKLLGAKKTNPPVARVAFWTDDESAKVNVNTASENTYWDTPASSNMQESGRINGDGTLLYDPALLALGASQPAKREYQRFPGHPATTSLSPIVRWMYPTGMTDPDFKEAIYRLAPRIAGGAGSSRGGSRTTDDTYQPDNRVWDRDRLFATLDEYWFRPDRSPITNDGLYPVFRDLGAGISDTRIPATATPVTPEALDRMRFFLTANSRSPELNLWGMPRVSIWPVAEKDSFDLATSKRSGFDDLITFCSTVATKPYIFARKDPWSTIVDYRDVGAETRGIDPVSGIDKIYPNNNRNRDLMEKYLKRLTTKNIPGVGSNFATKYSQKGPNSGTYTEMDRILLSIFDYIRCTNLVDTGRATTGGYPLAYTPGYSPKSPQDYTGASKPNLGSGQVAPTVLPAGDGGTPGIKGFGRHVTLGELGLMFYVDNTSLDGEPALTALELQNNLAVRCVVIPEMFTVSPGYPALSEGYAIRLSEYREGAVAQADPLKVISAAGPTELGIAPFSGGLSVPVTNFVEVDGGRTAYGRFFMPTRGWTNQFVHDNGLTAGSGGGRIAKTFSKVATNNRDKYAKYPFFSKRFLIKNTSGTTPPPTFSFLGGTFKLEILSLAVTNPANPAPDPSEGNVIQTIFVNFPPTELPTPKPGSIPFQQRYTAPASNDRDTARNLITINDVIRTMEPCGLAKGDYRLIAGNVIVPTSYWAPSGGGTPPFADYNTTTKMQVHNFRVSHGENWDATASYTWTGPNGVNTFASLTVGSTPRGDKRAKVAVTAQGSRYFFDPSLTGDYDRGLSKFTDGPFINKPDEGNTRLNVGDDLAGGGAIPYYRGGNGYEEVGESFFSPNRLISSPIMFGSLPSSLHANHPFETLLFSPPLSPLHKGVAVNPPDHYLLDMFQMPVVEPYAISEPLSMAGRVNLNSRIAPFGYVKIGTRGYLDRNTGIISVLTGMKQFSVLTGANEMGHHEKPLERSETFRFDLDIPTIINKVVTPYFDTKGYFRSPTQICELDLYTLAPGTTAPEFGLALPRRNYWEAHNLTGDNQRERTYSQIYPRLTTKSNVFTVHAWGQSIAKNPGTKDDAWDTFDESVDRVVGDYRGSTIIERFIDPNDPAMVGYDAVNADAKDLERYYRFRILSSKRFPGE